MRLIIPAILLLSLLSSVALAQVTGRAYLSDNADHSGIKVKFIADSPTAKTDSATTSADGSFSFNITGGVYFVVYSRTGYTTVQYNQNQPVAISATSTLQDVTLQASNYISVSGNVSGTWRKSNTYLVESNLVFTANSSLAIEPGTKVIFNGPYGLQVSGELIANGTLNENIYFYANQASQPILWSGITFGASSATRQIQYWNMENCMECIGINTNTFSVTNSTLSNFQNFGIKASAGTNAVIENNRLFHFRMGPEIGDYYIGQGIIAQKKSVVNCNILYDFRGTGIEVSDSAEVISNTIYEQHELGTWYHGAILALRGSPVIKNNFLFDNWSSVVTRAPSSGTYNPGIVNNTIIKSLNAGIWSTGNTGIVQNILMGHNRGISSDVFDANKITYNLFYDNMDDFNQYHNTYLGTIVSTNTNGDPIDSYFNVFTDPQFTEQPHVATNSAVKNAGSDQKDIGIDLTNSCIQIISSVFEGFVKSMSFSIYPNPVMDYIKISNEKKIKVVAAEIYSTMGIQLYRVNGGDLSSGISVSDLPGGNYFLILTTEDGSNYATPFIKQ